MNEPRIRDIYQDYRQGRVSFARVVQAADSYLDQYARHDTPSQPGSSSREPEPQVQND
ncbi:MAG: hypothetical protein WD058_08525 [Dehalococcoidia bacterium]